MKKITLLLAMIVSFFGFSQIDIDFESNGADFITAAGDGTATAIVSGAGTNTTLVASLSNSGDQYENYPLTIDPVSLADASQKIISVDFYNSTDTSRTVSIKLEGIGVDAVLVSVASDATAGWETLEFDFTTAIVQSGCYCNPIDASGVYTTMILFVSIGEFVASETAIDNLIFRDSTFSTNDVEQLDSISYFPNPVRNQLTIKAQSSIDYIQVYNLLGQSISTSTPRSNQTLVDTSTFNKGAYFVKVSVDNKVKTIRFIKN